MWCPHWAKMIMTVGVADTSKGDVGMTATATATVTATSMAGAFIGLMITGTDIMPRLRSSMHRRQRRVSASFYQFIAKVFALHQLPRFQAELIWAAVASNGVRYE
jgi:hypothetical protein